MALCLAKMHWTKWRVTRVCHTVTFAVSQKHICSFGAN